MPYRFLDDMAIADVAFEAMGNTREELFAAAAEALLNVMVAEPGTVKESEDLHLLLKNRELDMLLFDLLNELIFYKDAHTLLLRVSSVNINLADAHFTLTAEAGGERPDPARHPLAVDVKAVTLHRFRVEETDEGWLAEVVLDI